MNSDVRTHGVWRGCALACERANERVGKRESGEEKKRAREGREGGEEGGREGEVVVVVEGGGGKRMNTPMLIGDGTSVLMYVFLVCCAPRLASLRRSSLAH